ncbi:MAG: HEAT repeat domain-containing protein [Nitrospirae bacterium]|nr:HEAT repeat domain-containing protein [Nitrospirota bacterium]
MGDDIKKARDIVQSLTKSKKIVRMYPENNPIYINTLEEHYNKFKDFFYYKDDLKLLIRQNEILYESEVVYTSSEKEDNIALFFFKDGIRELCFKKGLPFDELESFLRIISIDDNRNELDDDIVTLFWEKDFQKIQHVVDELFLTDDEDYESKAVTEVKDKSEKEDNIFQAYEDALSEREEVKDASIVPLSDKDLQQLLQELDEDGLDKTPKLVDILFEMIFLSETAGDYDDLAGSFMAAVEFAVSRGDIQLASKILFRLKQTIDGEALADDVKKQLRRVIIFSGSDQVIGLIGEVLDSGQETQEKNFEEFTRYLDKNAIVPFMKILGELKTIHARKFVIDALIQLGNKDILLLARGLNDSRWYVVRNIIYILRKIGDKKAVDYLLKTVTHGDIRVRKEVIMTLGELGGTGVLQALRDCLDDVEIQVRTASLKALGNIGSEAAKRIILNKINDKPFKDRDFEEKKEFYEALARWNDSEVRDFLIETLRQSSFFGRSKNYEKRACAAHALGICGGKDVLPILNKYKNDGNKEFRESVRGAIKRIEHDK